MLRGKLIFHAKHDDSHRAKDQAEIPYVCIASELTACLTNKLTHELVKTSLREHCKYHKAWVFSSQIIFLISYEETGAGGRYRETSTPLLRGVIVRNCVPGHALRTERRKACACDWDVKGKCRDTLLWFADTQEDSCWKWTGTDGRSAVSSDCSPTTHVVELNVCCTQITQVFLSFLVPGLIPWSLFCGLVSSVRSQKWCLILRSWSVDAASWK